MSALTDYQENALLDYIFSSTTYWALSTTTPSDDGTNVTEPSGSGYARVTVAASSMSDAASGAIDNSAIVSFPEATGSWGTVTYLVIYDAASGGNALMYFELTTSKAISSGEMPRFSIGAFDMTAA